MFLLFNVGFNAELFLKYLERGTKSDELKSPGSQLIGSRIVHEEFFGTVHYVGGLPKSKGAWVGVDWDDATRGRHDGTFGGVRYFLPHSDTSGSFVRPEKLSEGTTLEEALFYRYVLCAECQLSVQLPNANGAVDSDKAACLFRPTDTAGRLDGLLGGCDDSPTEAEFTGVSVDTNQAVRIELFTNPSQCGGDAALRHANCTPEAARTALARLTSVCLSLVPVYRCLRWGTEAPPERVSVWPLPGGCLGELLPRLVDLDLSGCLLSRWIDLAEICVQLPNLEVLNVSSNRLRLPVPPDSCQPMASEAETSSLRLSYDLDTEPVYADRLLASAFRRLSKLVVVRNRALDWSGLWRVVAGMPCLRSLAVAYNKVSRALHAGLIRTLTQLGNPGEHWPPGVVATFRQLLELDLTCTGLTDVADLLAVIGPSPVLDSLVLSQNSLSDWPEAARSCVGGDEMASRPTHWFPSLTNLGLRATGIASWSAVRHLLRLPKLSSLIMSDCPLLEPFTFETAQQELIARLPQLTLLNRIQVTGDERRGAELDYLKRYGAAWHAAVEAAKEESPKNTVLSDFHLEHPTFSQLCGKHGAPEFGETKLVSKALKEGLVTITLACKSASEDTSATNTATPLSRDTFSRRIPVRMSVGRLRTMARRLFGLPARTAFDLVIESERYRRVGAEVVLESDTREVTFYNLEDGDTVYLRLA